MASFSELINKLELHQTLKESEAFDLQTEILSGQVETSDLIRVFELMSGRIANAAELTGILQASRESMKKINIDFPTLDTCSTGGDAIQIFNVSTLSAIVCASIGVSVAKHGNKSATSACGSFDLLEALELKPPQEPNQAQDQLKTHGLTFLFAPYFHPAFRFVKEARQKFGRKTYFNFLGPLINPAGSSFQVIGVSEEKMIPAMGQALMNSSSQTVWLLQGEDGLNEISPAGLTKVWEFRAGREGPQEFWINPEEYGLSMHSLEDIQCENIEQAVDIFWKVLKNEASQAQIDTVLLNAAAGLYVFGKVDNYLDGINLARESLISGETLKKFQELGSFAS